MVFAAAVSMKCGGGDPHAARLLVKWSDGLACQEVTIRTDKAPSICELARRARELRAEEATSADEVNSPGAFRSQRSGRKGHPDNWRPREEDEGCCTRKSTVSESVGGAPCRPVVQRLFSRYRCAHTVSIVEGTQVWYTGRRGLVSEFG